MSDMNPPPVSPAIFGKKDDAPAGDDTSPATYMGLFRRLLQLVSNTLATVQGDAAPGASEPGTNPVQVGGPSYSTMPTWTTGKRVPWSMGTSGAGAVTIYPANSPTPLSMTAPGDASSATLGRMAARSSLDVFNGSTFDRVKKATLHRLLSSAASVNATNVKSSAGDVFAIRGFNNNAAAIYLKLYNKATAPTVGTDTPVATIRLAPSANFDIQIGGAFGAYFSAGIGYGFTTAAADNSTAAIAAGDVACMVVDYA